jgi:UDP-2-acetamido-3-amino-2,3-dideoxy-glucuronate N-acetyltransferase
MHNLELISFGSNCRISENTSIGKYCSIGNNVIIGENCKIGQNVTIADGVIIGSNCVIQNNVCLSIGVICDDYVLIGNSTIVTEIQYFDKQKDDYKNDIKITRLNKGVKISANVTILSGTEIGCFAFISPGTFINKDIRPYALISGNTIKQSGWVSEHGCRLLFRNKDKSTTCPIS